MNYFDDQYDQEEESSGDSGNRGDSGPKGYSGSGDDSDQSRSGGKLKRGAKRIKKGFQKARQGLQRARQGAEAARTGAQVAGGAASTTGGAAAAGGAASAAGGAAAAGGGAAAAGGAAAGGAATAAGGAAVAGSGAATGGATLAVAAGAYVGKKGLGATKEAIKNPSSILTIPQRFAGWFKGKAMTVSKLGMKAAVICASFVAFLFFFIASFTAMEMIADKVAQASESFEDQTITVTGPTEAVGGQTLTYSVNITSNITVLGLIVKHTLSPNVEYVPSLTTGNPTYNPATRTLTWNTQNSLNPGNASFNLVVKVASAVKDIYILNIFRVFPIL